MSKHFRALALAEGCTLLLLMGVAVPLKHLAGWPTGSALMGPLHGMVVLLYLWAVFDEALTQGHGGRWMLAAMACSMVPGGSFAFAAWMNRRNSKQVTS